MLAASLNTTLTFQSASGQEISFHLARSKAYFNIWMADSSGEVTLHNIGGELIDVSVPLKGIPELSGILRRYRVSADPGFIEFWGYSVPYMISDLEHILFDEQEVPWMDNKYSKRINRLFYLLGVQLFDDQDATIRSRIDLFASLDTSFLAASHDPSTMMEDNPALEAFSSRLLQECRRLVESGRPNSDIANREPLREFLGLLQQNAHIWLDACRKLYHFVRSNATVPFADLYKSGNVF
jgi:hypothetical protein